MDVSGLLLVRTCKGGGRMGLEKVDSGMVASEQRFYKTQMNLSI